MSVVAEVYRDREDLARVLKKHTGIRKIVEDLYPDSAHFIYELLQNAEDTGATEVKFILSRKALIFEHNGRPFEERDIYAITDIGEGTKGTDEEKIGRFGIGFKAVFAYTETPRIWSPTFSFEITELVLPSEIESDPSLGRITRFEFPFNNPKKLESDAYSEVKSGLDKLSETTLLFLSHIESMRWQAEVGAEGCVLRVDHSGNHVEILKEGGGKTTESAHFLRFTHPVEGLESQQTAVAFVLDALLGVNQFDAKRPLAKQFRIIPAHPGKVSVFFEAEKETSGLRFHLHAPFVPELSRASIKETPANEPLIDQLATLTARSLFVIRDLGMLNADFLSVLPNPHDDIPVRYRGIRDAIVQIMNEQPLTPTYEKMHAPAKHLLQARAGLKSMLAPEDLEFLVYYDEIPYAWAIGATQKNSDTDRFLSGLAIKEWDVENFIDLLTDRLDKNHFYRDVSGSLHSAPDPAFLEWLEGKKADWHQKLYALLYRELGPEDELYRLEDLRIVRLSSGEYRIGSECYFPDDEVQQDAMHPRVERDVYTTGKSKTEKEGARKLLEAIGVREVGEFEQVEAILKQRYTKEAEIPNKTTYKRDFKRFISLVEADRKTSSLFRNYWIFERADGKWGQPGQVYLDAPYLNTGLHVYFEVLGEKAGRVALSQSYEILGIGNERLADFAQLVGASTKLEATEVRCRENPDWSYLRDVPGERYTSVIDKDYKIYGLDDLLSKPSLEISSLVWKTVCSLPGYPDYLIATYQKNRANGCRRVNSQLVHQLKNASWVPQYNNIFVRPAEANRDLLPEGFPFDPGWRWIKAVRFGEEVVRRAEEYQRKREVAKDLGFEDEAALNDAKWFSKLSSEDRRQFKQQYERSHISELPNNEPGNPERRAARVREQATDAPERTTEKRTRSVSVGRETVKKDTDPYLHQQYTNGDGVMICQVCKKALPFKLADESYYFEAVEFLPGLKKRHYQNYLALCPNHSAMYQHANGTSELTQDLFRDLTGNELEVVLAGENVTIYFTRTHLTDLRAILAADDSGNQGD